jgi:isochorismate hydrolase
MKSYGIGIIVTIVIITLSGCDFSSKGAPIKHYEKPRTALIVLDMQDDFIGNDAKFPIMKEQVDGIVDTVNRLIQTFDAEDRKSVV